MFLECDDEPICNSNLSVLVINYVSMNLFYGQLLINVFPTDNNYFYRMYVIGSFFKMKHFIFL